MLTCITTIMFSALPFRRFGLSDNSFLCVGQNTTISVIRSGNLKTIEAFKVNEGDYYIVPDEALKSAVSALDPLAYAVGYFIGNGCYTFPGKNMFRNGRRNPNAKVAKGGYYRVNFSFGNDEDELKPIFDDTLRCSGRSRGRGDVVYHSKELYSLWMDLYPKHGSHFTRIPLPILRGGPIAQRSFLAGMIDSDGSYHSRRMTIVSVSRTFIRQLHLMCQNLGIHGIIRKMHISNSNGTAWCFDVFEAESIKRLPEGYLMRKKCRLIDFREKSFTQCRTAMLPFSLLTRFNWEGLQRTILSNRLFSNGRRDGRFTRDSLRRAIDSNDACAPFSSLLNWRFLKVDRVNSMRSPNVDESEVELFRFDLTRHARRASQNLGRWRN